MLQKYKFKLLEHFIKTMWAHCLCKKELQPKFLQTERAYSDKNKTEVKQLKNILRFNNNFGFFSYIYLQFTKKVYIFAFANLGKFIKIAQKRV